MGLISTLGTIAPYHVLAYSLMFGATTYQSFFSGLMAYRVLPYKEFSMLQHKIFPPYFAFQTIAAAFLYVSSPTPLDCTAKTTLAIAFFSGLVNSLVLGPKSNKLIVARNEQVEAEGKSHKDPTASETMKKLNKQFGKLHGISVVINLGLWISMLTYGINLTERLTN
ncbi:hypothetical protein TRVA0_007S03246 [Trichomonascus vanleenenianus]|uniref:Tmh18p n=1 Tax=Trichomonascus vanleenenianus TaxID=2268995 RepID=UPI003ECA1D50